MYMYIHARPPSVRCAALYISMLFPLTHDPPFAPSQPKTGAMKIHLAKWFDPWMSGGNQFSDAIFTYANKELKELKVRTRVPAVLVGLRFFLGGCAWCLCRLFGLGCLYMYVGLKTCMYLCVRVG